MKKIVRILALVLVLAVLAGCSGKKETVTYTSRNLSMTVPASMQDVSGQPEYSDFTFTLDSEDMAIFGMQESFLEYPVLKGYTLQSYTELIITGNGLDTAVETRKGENYLYFTFSHELQGKEYKYLTATFFSADGFWMLQLSAPGDKYDQEAMLKYMDSVEFK